MLSTADTGSGYAPAFVGNGYLGARVPAEGAGYGDDPIETQDELDGFFGTAGTIEKRTSLPMWTALGFGDGTDSYPAQANVDYVTAYPVGATPPTEVAPEATSGTTSARYLRYVAATSATAEVSSLVIS